MRTKRVQMTAAALMAVMLLGGCGEEPYDLTKNEENVIVNYSAHVVAKYNTYQKEGLVYVAQEEDTEGPSAESTEAVTPEDELQVTGEELPVLGTEAGAEAAAQQVTLFDLFGQEGLQLDYVGARIADSYMEGTYYAMYPTDGNVYLILGIDITNTGEVPVTLDYLTRLPAFQATVNDTVTANAVVTVLTDDFSVFEGTLAAGETRETVLVFEVSDTVASVDNIGMTVMLDGNNYQIILANE